MSNKMTIKRKVQPVKKKKEEKKEKFSYARSRMRLPTLIPAIVFIVVAIWYFVSSME